jgi:YHS domain-containing protein
MLSFPSARTFGAALLTAFTLASPCLAQPPAGPVEALDGVDPVLLLQGKEVSGKPAIKVVRGRFEYLFASAETKATFEKDPAKYEIQLGGSCARMGTPVRGNPSDYMVHDGRIYIFGSDDCHKRFAAAPEKFLPKPVAPMPAAAGDLEQGRAFVERAVKALGGARKLDALTTYVQTSSQVQKRGDVEVPVTLKTMWRFPDAVRVERTMTMEGRSMANAVLMTAAGSWFIGQGRVYPQGPDARPANEEEYGRDIVPLLRARRDAGFKAAALGAATVDGISVDRVRVRHGAVDVTIGVDRASGRIQSLAFTGRNMAGEIGEYTLVYSDYRNVDGLMLPFSARALFNGSPDAFRTLAIDSIAINTPLDAALFEPGTGGAR